MGLDLDNINSDHQGGDGGLGDELKRLRREREEERWTAM